MAGNAGKIMRLNKYPLIPHIYIFFIKFLFICFSINTSYAEETLATVMQRMKSASAVKIDYQEIRSLELMDQPWTGLGIMYSLPPQIIIKQQLQPETVLMGADVEKLYFFDQQNDVRQQTEIDKNDPVSLNIIVFKALITGDEALLKRYYLLQFSIKPKRWMLLLTPKQATTSNFNVLVSGLLGEDADLIRIKQADGDLSEFLLQKSESGTEIKHKAEQLYQELQGN